MTWSRTTRVLRALWQHLIDYSNLSLELRSALLQRYDNQMRLRSLRVSPCCGRPDDQRVRQPEQSRDQYDRPKREKPPMRQRGKEETQIRPFSSAVAALPGSNLLQGRPDFSPDRRCGPHSGRAIGKER
jgi:hypothetical protein